MAGFVFVILFVMVDRYDIKTDHEREIEMTRTIV
jgi:hypothetical protein